MMEWLFDPQAWIALGTLTALEIVLGIDNIFAMAFSCGVEMLNMKIRQRAREPVQLHKKQPAE